MNGICELYGCWISVNFLILMVILCRRMFLFIGNTKYMLKDQGVRGIMSEAFSQMFQEKTLMYVCMKNKADVIKW